MIISFKEHGVLIDGVSVKHHFDNVVTLTGNGGVIRVKSAVGAILLSYNPTIEYRQAGFSITITPTSTKHVNTTQTTGGYTGVYEFVGTYTIDETTPFDCEIPRAWADITEMLFTKHGDLWVRLASHN